jgi:hypothetical protein
MQIARDVGNGIEETGDLTNKANGPEVQEVKAAKAVEVLGDASYNGKFKEI